ncbi:MAG: hypothetical protein EOP04_17785 [Proteobacteria bacterium]|nr:MAG: hypothetical protein EOP04_17785 [Pseudomonadota bacterium]
MLKLAAISLVVLSPIAWASQSLATSSVSVASCLGLKDYSIARVLAVYADQLPTNVAGLASYDLLLDSRIAYFENEKGSGIRLSNLSPNAPDDLVYFQCLGFAYRKSDCPTRAIGTVPFLGAKIKVADITYLGKDPASGSDKLKVSLLSRYLPLMAKYTDFDIQFRRDPESGCLQTFTKDPNASRYVDFNLATFRAQQNVGVRAGAIWSARAEVLMSQDLRKLSGAQFKGTAELSH